MNHLVQITGKNIWLKGPYTPQQVRKCGYGFTESAARAWPFASAAQARAKAKILADHMSWKPESLMVVTMKPKRGGKREGSGRKPADDPAKCRGIRCTDGGWQWLNAQAKKAGASSIGKWADMKGKS